jgi:hypothetical protein
MKLIVHYITTAELQDYLDKYQEKIKFLFYYTQNQQDKLCIVIDEA